MLIKILSIHNSESAFIGVCLTSLVVFLISFSSEVGSYISFNACHRATNTVRCGLRFTIKTNHISHSHASLSENEHKGLKSSRTHCRLPCNRKPYQGLHWNWKWKSLCSVRLFAIPWTVLQAEILEWVAFPFSSWSSRYRNGTGVSCIAGGFLTSWVTMEAQEYWNG